MRRSLSLVVAATLAATAACSGNTQVNLEQLAEWQETYAGQRVATVGVVSEEHDADGSSYFVLSDPSGHRVGLQPSATASHFKGRLVEVSGLFEIQPGFGRVIHIAAISSDAATR